MTIFKKILLVNCVRALGCCPHKRSLELPFFWELGHLVRNSTGRDARTPNGCERLLDHKPWFAECGWRE
jgi:hypothetical protein